MMNQVELADAIKNGIRELTLQLEIANKVKLAEYYKDINMKLSEAYAEEADKLLDEE